MRVGIVLAVVVGEAGISRVVVVEGVKLGWMAGVSGTSVALGGTVVRAVVTVGVALGNRSPLVQACRKIRLITPAIPIKSRYHFRVQVEPTVICFLRISLVTGRNFPSSGVLSWVLIEARLADQTNLA